MSGAPVPVAQGEPATPALILPPLPEPAERERVYGGHGNELIHEFYTKNQMREYARQSVYSAQQAAPVAQPLTPAQSHADDLLAAHGNHAELLREAAELFRFYEQSHRARGPEHLAKAERNAEIAGRIEDALAAPAPVAPVYTYASTQATKCAGCLEHKHTPLRVDAMGGYVCLTCIDKKLGELLGEFGREPTPAPVVPHDLLVRMALALEVVDSEWRKSDPGLRIDIAAAVGNGSRPDPVVQGELVAWDTGSRLVRSLDELQPSELPPRAPKATPLYRSPATVVQPLTDAQLDALRQGESRLNFVTLREFRAIARAIERALGITGEQK